jgi:hypothetical protein
MGRWLEKASKASDFNAGLTSVKGKVEKGSLGKKSLRQQHGFMMLPPGTWGVLSQSHPLKVPLPYRSGPALIAPLCPITSQKQPWGSLAWI